MLFLTKLLICNFIFSQQIIFQILHSISSANIMSKLRKRLNTLNRVITLIIKEFALCRHHSKNSFINLEVEPPQN